MVVPPRRACVQCAGVRRWPRVCRLRARSLLLRGRRRDTRGRRRAGGRRCVQAPLEEDFQAVAGVVGGVARGAVGQRVGVAAAVAGGIHLTAGVRENRARAGNPAAC
eukprot:3907795-Pleurochrysis_carterae.AAC.1